MMSDEELIKFATEFRKVVFGNRPSTMRCAMLCWPLASLLRMHGVKCSTVESDLGELNHVWIKLEDGRALDPTIDQFNSLFGEKLPKVYLGKPIKYHGVLDKDFMIKQHKVGIEIY